MSDQRPLAAAQPDQEIEALQREKLEAEVRKLKVDNSFFNRLFTTILSVSAVVIAGSQIWMASQQRAADNERAKQNDELRQDELDIQRVESGLSLSEFAFGQRALFLSADKDEQIRAIRLVQALLPNDEARRMLNAFGALATQAEVLSEVEQGKRVLATVPAEAPPPALGHHSGGWPVAASHQTLASAGGRDGARAAPYDLLPCAPAGGP